MVVDVTTPTLEAAATRDGTAVDLRLLRRLVDVDGRRQVAVVAEVDGQCAGIARWIALA